MKAYMITWIESIALLSQHQQGMAPPNIEI